MKNKEKLITKINFHFWSPVGSFWLGRTYVSFEFSSLPNSYSLLSMSSFIALAIIMLDFMRW